MRFILLCFIVICSSLRGISQTQAEIDSVWRMDWLYATEQFEKAKVCAYDESLSSIKLTKSIKNDLAALDSIYKAE